MKNKIISIWNTINLLRTIPALILFAFSPAKEILIKDILRWKELVLKEDGLNKPIWKCLHLLLLQYPEFRNLFYYRIKKYNFILGMVIQPFYPRLKSLYIISANIGAGFVIYHGFSTIIYAKSIGEDCSVGQQVTIGKTTDCPIIEDGVKVTAGAFVIGGITVGENSVIGANSTVTKNVPKNCTVVGNPAYIIRKNGEKTKEEL